jgi:hypothetical protein
MLETQKDFNQLDATLAVEELDNQTSAAIQGGAAMTLYRHSNPSRDILGQFDGGGLRTLSSNANNQASSVRITEGKWKFYNFPYWNPLGGSVELGVGHWNFTGLNDKISSFKRVG